MEEKPTPLRRSQNRLSMCAGEAELCQKNALAVCQCDVLQPQPSCLEPVPSMTGDKHHVDYRELGLGICHTLLPASTRTLCLNKHDGGYTLTVLRTETDEIFLFLPLDGILDGSLLYDNSQEYWHEVTVSKPNRPAQHLVFNLKISEESKSFNQCLSLVKKEIFAKAESDSKAAPADSRGHEWVDNCVSVRTDSTSSKQSLTAPSQAGNSPLSRPELVEQLAATGQGLNSSWTGLTLMQEGKLDPNRMQQLCEELAAAIRVGDVRRTQEIAARMAMGQAQVTVSSNVSQQKSPEQEISITVHVEDRESALTLKDIKVHPSDTIADLKQLFLGKYGFPSEVQKWIIGKKIRTDGESLSRCDVSCSGHTLYLYLLNARAGNITVSREEYHRTHQLTTNEGQGNKGRGQGDASGDYESLQMPARNVPGTRDLDVAPPSQSCSSGQGHHQTAAAPRLPLRRPTVTSGSSLPSDFPTMSDITTPPELTSSPFSGTGFGQASAVGRFSAGVELTRTGHAAPSHRTSSAPEIFHQEGHAEEEPASLGQLGWQCGTCTLINKPTRPGCEACGAARPEDYRVPEGYVMMEEERQRHEHEQREEELMLQSQRSLREQNYQQLLQADNEDLVCNASVFTCPICFEEIPVGQGVVLRECLHQFCRSCLVETVRLAEEVELACPYTDDNYACNARLQDREIRAVVSHEIYERHLQRSLSVAERQETHSYHCVTTDCPGWCIYEDNVNFFHCPVCRRVNCLTCRAVHHGMDCRQYQEDLKLRAANDIAARQTQEVLQDMLKNGEAMECPQCRVILQKKDGCDWIRCSICKTEICWVTRGHRWGPDGKGDVSGGCRCRVDGQKCHPQCNNCH